MAFDTWYLSLLRKSIFLNNLINLNSTVKNKNQSTSITPAHHLNIYFTLG